MPDPTDQPAAVPPTWIDHADQAWGFDHVYLWLWNTTGEAAPDGALIGPIQPLPDRGSRIVRRPDTTATWEVAPDELLWARGVIATLPNGAPLWFSAFHPSAGRGGTFTVHLPAWFWDASYDLAHRKAPDANGHGGDR